MIHIIDAWNLSILIVLKVHIFIKASTSRACSRICRSLSLSFYWFHHFSCFLVYSTKGINRAILNILSIMRPNWLHIFIHLIDIIVLRCSIHLLLLNNYWWSTMSTHIRRLLPSFTYSSWRLSFSTVSWNWCFRLNCVHLITCFYCWWKNCFFICFYCFADYRLLLSINCFLSSISWS